MEYNREYAKTVSKAVKNYFKVVYGTGKGVSVSMTAGVKYPYVSLWLSGGLRVPVELRKKALETIYGVEYVAKDTDMQARDYVAGNVWENHIAMKPNEWEMFLK